jgi:hypothetical protein
MKDEADIVSHFARTAKEKKATNGNAVLSGPYFTTSDNICHMKSHRMPAHTVNALFLAPEDRLLQNSTKQGLNSLGSVRSPDGAVTNGVWTVATFHKERRHDTTTLKASRSLAIRQRGIADSAGPDPRNRHEHPDL